MMKCQEEFHIFAGYVLAFTVYVYVQRFVEASEIDQPALRGPHVCSFRSSFYCCPGWTHSVGDDSALCSTPICKQDCRGGRCIAPDLCLCTDGSKSSSCTQGKTRKITAKIAELKEKFDNSTQVDVLGYSHTGKEAPNDHCPGGYWYNKRDEVCYDIDECSGVVSPCHHRCHNIPGSYICTCDPGFLLHKNGISCVDENECEDTLGATRLPCQHLCVNTYGSYRCMCHQGFKLEEDGRSCRDVNECQLYPGICMSKCVNLVGSYLCKCDPGYVLRSGACVDENECASYNKGGCMQDCVNTEGSYFCSCLPGFVLADDGKSCNAIFVIPGHKVEIELKYCEPECQNGGTCYHGICACPDGLTGNACEIDKNECLSKTHGCEQLCKNTFGGYECFCEPGYTLSDDKKSCYVNKCEPECMNGGECVNGTCYCLPGYLGTHCQLDYDECRLFRPCSHKCVNLMGGYQCICPEGMWLGRDGYTCIGPGDCDPPCFGGMCINATCICPFGVTGVSCIEDVNECKTEWNICEQICVNTFGGFHCDCRRGYKLEDDEISCTKSFEPQARIILRSRPPVPTNLTLVGKEGGILINWTVEDVRKANEPEYFTLWFRRASQKRFKTTKIQGNARSYLLDDLLYDEKYVMFMVSHNALGNSAFSDLETCTTLPLSEEKEIRGEIKKDDVAVSEINATTESAVKCVAQSSNDALNQNTSVPLNCIFSSDFNSSINKSNSADYIFSIKDQEFKEFILKILYDVFSMEIKNSSELPVTQHNDSILEHVEVLASGIYLIPAYPDGIKHAHPVHGDFQESITNDSSGKSFSDNSTEQATDSISTEEIARTSTSTRLIYEENQNSLLKIGTTEDNKLGDNKSNLPDDNKLSDGKKFLDIPDITPIVDGIGKPDDSRKKKMNYRAARVVDVVTRHVDNLVKDVGEVDGLGDEKYQSDVANERKEWRVRVGLRSSIDVSEYDMALLLAEADCEHHSGWYLHGELFTPLDDPCQICACLNADVRCRNATCPTLHCKKKKRYSPTGYCCPICKTKTKGKHKPDEEQPTVEKVQHPEINVVTNKSEEENSDMNDMVTLNYTEEFTATTKTSFKELEEYSTSDTYFSVEYSDHTDHVQASYETIVTSPTTVIIEDIETTSDGYVRHETTEERASYAVTIGTTEAENIVVIHQCFDSSGIAHNVGSEWNESSPICSTCTCSDDGTISCSRIACTQSCSHPVFLDGECCSSCVSCFSEAHIYSDGEIFEDPSDKCSECRCLSGSIHCKRNECDVPCVSNYIPPGQCCPICFGILTVREHLRNVAVLVGNKFRLKCSIVGVPHPNYSWTKDGVVVDVQAKRISVKNTKKTSMLRIKKARESDTGLYTCIANNGRDHVETSAHVLVHKDTADGIPSKGFHMENKGTGEIQPNPDTKGELSKPANNNPYSDNELCVQYRGEICNRYLSTEAVYSSDDSLVQIENQMASNLRKIISHLSNVMDAKCSNYFHQALCYYTFPVCSGEVDVVYQKHLCREDCEKLQKDTCGSVYGKVHHSPELRKQIALPDCDNLPLQSDGADCTNIFSHDDLYEGMQCIYNDRVIEHGESINLQDSTQDLCQECKCLVTKVRCKSVACPGDCVIGAEIYKDGENFSLADSECQECTCQNSTVNCTARSCGAVCTHGLAVSGQCCMDCSVCEFNGKVHKEGATFIPNDADPCHICTCQQGSVLCDMMPCPAVTCSVTETVDGQCCPQCQKCEFDGVHYEHGDIWTMEDDCTLCVCNDTSIQCKSVSCPSECRDPLDGGNQTCCASCKGCSHEDITYLEEATFRHADDDCTQCTCKVGYLHCGLVHCPALSCSAENRILPNGTCCPVCVNSAEAASSCTIEGFIYSDGTQFQLGACTTCLCSGGELTCETVQCPPLDCPQEKQVLWHEECCSECLNGSCIYQGLIYEHGEQFVPPGNQCSFCQCMNEEIACKPIDCPTILSCPEGQTLGKIPGECCNVCIPNSGHCSTFGMFKYKSYDGHLATLPHSKCATVFTETCENYAGFQVLLEFGSQKNIFRSFFKDSAVLRRSERGRKKQKVQAVPAFTEMNIRIFYSNHTVLLKENSLVLVNGWAVPLPYNGGGLRIFREGALFVVYMDPGVKLYWDGRVYLDAVVEGYYKGKMCGLCGNFNGLQKDDGTSIYTDSWYVPEGEKISLGECEPAGMQKCRPKRKLKLACDMLKKGLIFISAHELISPAAYKDACKYISCVASNGMQSACDVMAAYARAVRNKGLVLEWRERTNCAIHCPVNAVYTECGPECRRTCETAQSEDTCYEFGCIPGCFCDSGYILHSGKCILEDSCPAVV